DAIVVLEVRLKNRMDIAHWFAACSGLDPSVGAACVQWARPRQGCDCYNVGEGIDLNLVCDGLQRQAHELEHTSILPLVQDIERRLVVQWYFEQMILVQSCQLQRMLEDGELSQTQSVNLQEIQLLSVVLVAHGGPST